MALATNERFSSASGASRSCTDSGVLNVVGPISAKTTLTMTNSWIGPT
jgi:hypothetical protein